ncbi:2-amino-4-hydroxy-6-hydroxymethyldihydropteridine diphosphokinase [Thiohalobacter sp. IOR34]|uniref:2-amino-4-hydroxy-6- hydroxymethyldihydropteridine diphosphokinase n=1 Tax=Thiohalobacter sp. IOR34 TaxID=3057176 RepID=UPI0025AECE7E|nr:2-amino-4-hydroxy-6-hydroxymethyldihydropteridine diphosphokinase [Thiohalobacter sp. IOR34]WJW74903.1 2-amino-4-hydroxy-6-hydroxymethyldihydropteridine diphosphokinase [Thiohalobacter sp. IOR34]
MSSQPVRAYLGLGSNLEQPHRQLRQALVALATLPESRLVRCSAFYRSPPMGPAGQPDYLNAVAALETRLPAEELLDRLQAIEAAQGRVRGGLRWGPRTLDLDLLLYGQERIDSPRLQVPHPGLAERAFVLYPLAEIAPDLQLPGLGPLAELLRACPRDGLERLGDDD